MKPIQDPTHFTRNQANLQRRKRTELTDRDIDLLHAMVFRVRVFSLEQIAKTWWHSARNLSTTANRLKQLQSAGYIELEKVFSHPIIALDNWSLHWQPGWKTPNFDATSYQLKSRWGQAPVPTHSIIASNLSGVLLGGSAGRFSRPSEVAHDFHLAEVYLKYRKENPDLAAGWTGESELVLDRPKRKGIVPDAIIDTKTVRKVIDFGGSYSANRLRELHDYCDGEQLAYEVW